MAWKKPSKACVLWARLLNDVLICKKLHRTAASKKLHANDDENGLQANLETIAMLAINWENASPSVCVLELQFWLNNLILFVLRLATQTWFSLVVQRLGIGIYFFDLNYLDFGWMRRNAFVFLTKRKSRAFTSGHKDKLQEQTPCFQSRQMALKDKKERCTLYRAEHRKLLQGPLIILLLFVFYEKLCSRINTLFLKWTLNSHIYKCWFFSNFLLW